MRAFTKLRKILAPHEDLRRKLETMEKKYDAQFKIVFDAIKSLMSPPTKEQNLSKISWWVGEFNELRDQATYRTLRNP